MQPLAFVATRIEERRVDLTPCAACEVSTDAWDEFAAWVAREPTLISYPGCVFRARWEQGSAAVAVCAGHIVSYTSLMAAFDTTFRMKMAGMWRYVNGSLPPIDVYEFATGWTDPEWRRNDISLGLRQQLLQRFNAPHILCVSVGVGLGAAPVLDKLGWSILGWNQIAYVSSLIAVPLAGYETQIGQGWLIPSGKRLYEGTRLTYESSSSHPWKQYCHFCVAEEALARRLDADLCAAAGGELSWWRDAIVRTHAAAPAPYWKLSFYKE